MNRLLASPWPVPVAVWLASRLVVLIGLWRGSGQASPGALLSVATGRYDAGWYGLIARYGYLYKPEAAAFYPGYPILGRLLSLVVGRLDLAMLLVSNLALLAAAVCLYHLYAPRWGRPAAILGLGLLVAAPSGIFLALAFSEGAFLAATAAAFLAASRGRWVLAGLAGAAACLIRSNGALLALPLLLLAVSARAWRRPIPLLSGVAIFAAGVFAYPAYLALVFHDPLRYLHLQATLWHHRPTNPLGTVWVGVSRMRAAGRALLTLHPGTVRPQDGAAVFNDGALLLAALAALVAGIRRLNAAEWTWILLILLPPLATFPVPDSIARYLLAAFPIYFLAGHLSARWPAAAFGLMAIGLAFQGELAFRIAQGYFIG